MEIELPDQLRLKWTEGGSLFHKAETMGLASSPKSFSPLASSTDRLNIKSTVLSVSAIRRYCAGQRQGGVFADISTLKLNLTQMNARAAIAADEVTSWRAIMQAGGGMMTTFKNLRLLCEEESKSRLMLQMEVKDFVSFAQTKEPQWRKIASDSEARRLLVAYSMNALTSLYTDEFAKLKDTLYAISLEEKDYRDLAYARQFQREEQHASERLARTYEQERLNAEREAEQKRLQELQQRQQQQARPNTQYGNANNFAMPPSNAYGGGGGYNYNYGPSAGAYYGGSGYPGARI